VFVGAKCHESEQEGALSIITRERPISMELNSGRKKVLPYSM
jgi:hypothetical protein